MADGNYWGSSSNSYNYNKEHSQDFDFQPYDSSRYLQPNDVHGHPTIFTPTLDYPGGEEFCDELSTGAVYYDEYGEPEPPLLDELEIYPERIVEKSLAVLNPYSSGLANDPDYLFQQTDLAGPVMFCIGLATSLFVSGHKANFGYIYGLSLISVLLIYTLISLMCNNPQNYISITGVASILGYCILPVVWLSILGIFLSLNTKFGLILTGLSILLSTVAASRIFTLMTGEPRQRYLFAFPCALVYILFALLVLF